MAVARDISVETDGNGSVKAIVIPERPASGLEDIRVDLSAAEGEILYHLLGQNVCKTRNQQRQHTTALRAWGLPTRMVRRD